MSHLRIGIVRQHVGYQSEWMLDRPIPDYIKWLRHNRATGELWRSVQTSSWVW
jgi:hypothetical protein